MVTIRSLAELSDPAILLIIRDLSLEDLQNLRMTCKKLKKIVDKEAFRSLHFFVRAYPSERELFHTGELIAYANTYHSSGLSILKSAKFKIQFSGLLKLTIHHKCYYASKDFLSVNLYDLNCFEHLVHLELHELGLENGTLRLGDLKVAFLSNVNRENTKFELDCPRLKALGLGYRTEPVFSAQTSGSIEHLHVKDGRGSESYLRRLYPQLLSLSTICFSSGHDLNRFIFDLQKSRVCLCSLEKVQLKELNGLSRRTLENLLSLKSSFETMQIKVQINSKMMRFDELTEMVKVHRQTSLDQNLFNSKPFARYFLAHSNRNPLRHFKEHPILHCLLEDVRDLNLKTDEDVALAESLIGKLKNLGCLTFGREIKLDENLFDCFLKRCRRIWHLNIEGSCLRQAQLDRMTNYLQSLQILYLKDDLYFEEDFSFGNYNLDFVIQFKNLFLLQLGFYIGKETMSSLLNTCQHQPNFRLELRGKQTIWIFTPLNGRVTIICGSQENRSNRNSSNKKINLIAFKRRSNITIRMICSILRLTTTCNQTSLFVDFILNFECRPFKAINLYKS